MPQVLVEELARHLELHPTDDLVFTSPEGKPISRSNWQRRYWRPAVEAAGLGSTRFHDVRHTSVSLLIAAGLHPKVIQARSGHSSISVTMDIYGGLFDRADAGAADALDALAHSDVAQVWTRPANGGIP